MRVIEQGTPFLKQLRCTGKGNGGNGCNALLEVEMNDLRFFKGAEGIGAYCKDPEVLFRCPCCGQCTDLDRKDWPFAHDKKLKPFSTHWRETGCDPEEPYDDRPR